MPYSTKYKMAISGERLSLDSQEQSGYQVIFGQLESITGL